MKDAFLSGPHSQPPSRKGWRLSHALTMKDSIPAELLKLNLGPLEFRLLCHFYIWGTCIHAVPTLARECHATRVSVIAAIDELVSRGFITKTRRRRQTSVYTFTLRSVEMRISRQDQISTPGVHVQGGCTDLILDRIQDFSNSTFQENGTSKEAWRSGWEAMKQAL